MENSTDPIASSAPSVVVAPFKTEVGMTELSSLLTSLDEAAQADSMSSTNSHQEHQSRIAQTRLGLASSLFTALRVKHAPTADHCLRVALGCSSWTLSREMPEQDRDMIEIAALLHDVGKIGVPDYVLSKPGKLAGEEVLQMEQHKQLGRNILTGCCSSTDLLDTICHVAAWFNGSRHGFDLSGEDLPLGSRMIAIVDAFDAMTTDHIYRRAMPRERAMVELFEFAGTQFDPQLVREFCELLSSNRVQFGSKVARRWLQEIDQSSGNQFWGYSSPSESVTAADSPVDTTFPDHLLETMHDGVLFVDAQLKITLWNRAVERLTGIAPAGVVGKQWEPALLAMHDERGTAVPLGECPVVEVIRTGEPNLRRLSIVGRNSAQVSVDIHVSPVLGADAAPRGATVLLHDASSQITLEERVQTLYEKATRDPLTKCANRSEFDRVFPLFVETHLKQGVPCSMIMCDIDHFKSINDTFGHQAGDKALTCFGTLLRRHARAGDLVARYGGEEFVLLCADCDNATATRRAESLRKKLAGSPQKSLAGRSITASFGVTEIQAGDNPETFLRRADRALLQAKDNGRNIVVQLGTGIGDEEEKKSLPIWLRWLSGRPGQQLMQRDLITAVPVSVVAEKLRGYMADHTAELVSVEQNKVCLRIGEQHAPLMRRWSDRPVPFLIELTLEEVLANSNPNQSNLTRTAVHVSIRPKRQRDRRRRDVNERARKLVVSLKAYLMAHDREIESEPQHSENRESFIQNTQQVLSDWLTK